MFYFILFIYRLNSIHTCFTCSKLPLRIKMLRSNVDRILSRPALFYLGQSNLFSDMEGIFFIPFERKATLYQSNFRKIGNIFRSFSRESISEKKLTKFVRKIENVCGSFLRMYHKKNY